MSQASNDAPDRWARIRYWAERAQIDRPGLVFGFRTGATAWVAFAIASLLHVQNAYWAAMAAWIVMQPTRGILLERGFYRLIGTVVGAAAGFAILHLVHQPFVAVGVLGVWVGLCAALTHVFRRVKSYGATLGGITAVVVVLPTLHAAEQTFELALARVLCTLVGVAVATASGLLFVPASPQEAFLARLRKLAADAVLFVHTRLTSIDAKLIERKAAVLLEEMAALEQALLINTAGTRNSPHWIHHFSAFVGAALEVMAASRAVVDGQPDVAHVFPKPLALSLGDLAQGLQDQSAPQPDDVALAALTAFDARLGESLSDLAVAQADMHAGAAELASGRFRRTPVEPEHDYEVAAMSGVVACIAVAMAGCAALMSSWPFAPLAALGVGNFVMVLSMMERPHLVAPKIVIGVCSGVVAATVFRVFVLPHAHSTGDVLWMVIPFMVLGALLRASRITILPAVDFNMCFMLAGQPFLPAETTLSVILQGGAALIIGVVIVGGGHMLLPRDPGKRVRRIADLIVRDLERMADLAGNAGSDPHWRQLTAYRMIRLTTHLSRMENLQVNKPRVVLAALNLGYAVRDLRSLLLEADLPLMDRAVLGDVIASVRHLAEAPLEVIATLARAQQSARNLPANHVRPVSCLLARTEAALKQTAPLWKSKTAHQAMAE